MLTYRKPILVVKKNRNNIYRLYGGRHVIEISDLVKNPDGTDI